MPNRYFTASIPYVNADPHIGYALELVQTDALIRYYRQQGVVVRGQYGSDDNSLKVVRAAQAAGEEVEAKQIAPTNVSKILIRHDGSFSAERMREKVTIMLLNEKGDLVENPENVQKIYLRTAYGKAEFYPDTISASNFVKGKAEIEMLTKKVEGHLTKMGFKIK
jgi:isoleucyl-tRNA synthetase